MNKLTRVERQRKYFNSVERLKRLRMSNPKRRKSPSRTVAQKAIEKEKNLVAQREYDEQQLAINSARWQAELAQLRKELDKLYEDRTKR